MDAVEKLVYYKTHDLPEQKEERVQFLEELIRFPFFYIYYDDVCEYLPAFKERYSENVIRDLFRKHNILGKNVAEEIEYCAADEEEKMLMRLFFKGRTDELWL